MQDTTRDIEYQRYIRGMCSDANCCNPIYGWCETCEETWPITDAPKLCGAHLVLHIHHNAGHRAHDLYGVEVTRG